MLLIISSHALNNITDSRMSYSYDYHTAVSVPRDLDPIYLMTNDVTDADAIFYVYNYFPNPYIHRFRLSTSRIIQSLDWRGDYSRWGLFQQPYATQLISVDSNLLVVCVNYAIVKINPSSGAWWSAWTTCHFERCAYDTTNQHIAVICYFEGVKVLTMDGQEVTTGPLNVRDSLMTYHSGMDAWVLAANCRLTFYQSQTFALLQTIDLTRSIFSISELSIDLFGSLLLSSRSVLCVYYVNTTTFESFQCLPPNGSPIRMLTRTANGGVLAVYAGSLDVVVYNHVDVMMPLWNIPQCSVVSIQGYNAITTVELNAPLQNVVSISISRDPLSPDLLYYIVWSERLIHVFNLTIGADIGTLDYGAPVSDFILDRSLHSINASLLAVFSPSDMVLVNLIDQTYRTLSPRSPFWSRKSMAIDPLTNRGCWILDKDRKVSIEIFSLSSGEIILSAPIRTADYVHSIQFHSIWNTIYVLVYRPLNGQQSTRFLEIDGNTLITRRIIDMVECGLTVTAFNIDMSRNMLILTTNTLAICLFSLNDTKLVTCSQPSDFEHGWQQADVGINNRLATVNGSNWGSATVWDISSIIPDMSISSSSSAGTHPYTSSSLSSSYFAPSSSLDSNSSSSSRPEAESSSSSSMIDSSSSSVSSGAKSSSSLFTSVDSSSSVPFHPDQSSSSSSNLHSSSTSSYHHALSSSSSNRPEESFSSSSSSGTNSPELENYSSGSSLSSGAIAGVVIGVLIGVILAVAMVVFLCSRYSLRSSEQEEEKFVEMTDASFS